MACDTCRELLAEGLDLCVRARKMDAQDRANSAIAMSKEGEAWESSGDFAKYAAEASEDRPHQPIETKSATMHIWVQDQYDKDLHEWEQRTRHHLMQGCEVSHPSPVLERN